MCVYVKGFSDLSLMNSSILHIFTFWGVRIFKFCFLSEFQLYNIVLISFGHQCYTLSPQTSLFTTETLYLLTSLCLLPYLSQTQAATILLLEFNYFFFRFHAISNYFTIFYSYLCSPAPLHPCHLYGRNTI